MIMSNALARLYILDADDVVDLRHKLGEHGPEHQGVGAQRPGADLHSLVSNLKKSRTVICAGRAKLRNVSLAAPRNVLQEA